MRRVLFKAEDMVCLDNIWLAVKRAIDSDPRTECSNGLPISEPYLKSKSSCPARGVRLAAATCGLAFAVALLVSTVRYLGHSGESGSNGSMAETSGFILHSARIENEPANTYIIHPKDDGMVVVWVEKSQ
jgi:hypothetical protein